jgi:hypothetical protein
MLSNPELAIDEGTISLSSQYSQGYVRHQCIPTKQFLFFQKFTKSSVFFMCSVFGMLFLVFAALEFCVDSQ